MAKRDLARDYYKGLKHTYDNIVMQIHASLAQEISESKLMSKHVNVPCIKVNVLNYVELIILDGKLVFLDSQGLQYSAYTCTNDILLDILMNLE